MVRVYLIITVLLLVAPVFGCKEKSSNPVQEYGNTLIDSYERAQRTADTTNLAIFRRSVQAYRSANGKNPESLQDLENFLGEKIDPDKYEYDPETGVINIK